MTNQSNASKYDIRISQMTNQSNASKYDIRINPVYQVDWKHEAKGKHIAFTKRVIRWKFGFSNAAAIQAGEFGPACRGEEHEVVLVWSVSSGKRQVTFDDKEVHLSIGKSESTFETSWTIVGGHTVHLIAHSAPPRHKSSGLRQFDLLLDGCSYFLMPKIYELGAGKKESRAPLTRSAASSSSNKSGASSMTQSGSFEQHNTPKHSPRLIASTSEITDMMSVDSMSTIVTVHDNEFARVAQPDPRSFMQIQKRPTLHSPATIVQNSATLVAPETRLFKQSSNQTTTSYRPTPMSIGAPAAATGMVYALQSRLPMQHLSSATYGQSQPSSNQHYAQQKNHQGKNSESPFTTASSQPTPVVSHLASQSTHSAANLTMKPTLLQGIETYGAHPMSEMEHAVKSLVNLQDISTTIETPEQRKFQQTKAAECYSFQSKPLPPNNPGLTTGSTVLQDINIQFPTLPAPSQAAMRTTDHVQVATDSANAMVPYGSLPHGVAPPFVYPPRVYPYEHQPQPQAYMAHMA